MQNQSSVFVPEVSAIRRDGKFCEHSCEEDYWFSGSNFILSQEHTFTRNLSTLAEPTSRFTQIFVLTPQNIFFFSFFSRFFFFLTGVHGRSMVRARRGKKEPCGRWQGAPRSGRQGEGEMWSHFVLNLIPLSFFFFPFFFFLFCLTTVFRPFWCKIAQEFRCPVLLSAEEKQYAQLVHERNRILFINFFCVHTATLKYSHSPRHRLSMLLNKACADLTCCALPGRAL